MIHFTADTHFEHENLIGKMGRVGFDSIEQHDQTVLANINAVVAKGDVLYILGDFAWKNQSKWRQRINCKRIYFVVGNHDKHDATKKAFGELHQIKVAKLSSGERAVCCHYPMAFWPSSHHGAYHFYGHMHAQREETLDAMFPDRRSIDVGVDNARRLLGCHRPFSEQELMAILAGRPGHDPVSYYEGLREKPLANPPPPR